MTCPLVFLLDDDADSVETYAIFLSEDGFTVLTSTSVADALSRVCVARPDIFIADLKLPDGSGLQVVRHLRDCEQTVRTPIIALTGCAYGSYVSEAIASGCDVVLTKPCLPHSLVSNVRALLSHSESHSYGSAH